MENIENEIKEFGKNIKSTGKQINEIMKEHSIPSIDEEYTSALLENLNQISEKPEYVELGNDTMSRFAKDTMKIIKAYGKEQKKSRKKVDELEGAVLEANEKDWRDIWDFRLSIIAIIIAIISVLI